MKAMKYDTKKLAAEALRSGFSSAGELSMDALVFMPEVRAMCAADRCGHFGRNWRCPPACGSVEEAAAEASGYSCGLIVQTVGKMNGDFDHASIEAAMEKHKADFGALVRELRLRYGRDGILPLGAGACTLCGECAYPDAPCRHPDDAISSMEAYGLWVSRVCELSGIPYNYGRHTIAFTSCYLLR
jgi:predicted metal-binding protein